GGAGRGSPPPRTRTRRRRRRKRGPRSWLGQPELLDLAVERGAADLEELAGPPLVPLGGAERALDGAALHLAQGEHLVVVTGRGRARPVGEREQALVEDVPLGGHHRAREHVLELAGVARARQG